LARKRIKMKKIREIIKLKAKANLSERQISKSLSVSRPVVSEYLRKFKASGLNYEQIINIADSKLLALFQSMNEKYNLKYKTLLEYFPAYIKDLSRKGVTLQLLWEEYKEKHPEGYQYSQFCYHFQVWRNASEITMHIKHKAGDKMFVDYAGETLSIYDPATEEEKTVEVFAAILGGSGLTYAEASLSQKKEEWIRSNERAFWYFGGVSKAIVPDNLKSAITRSDPYEPGISPDFDDFADHYGTVIIPARARKWRDKALVENAVRLIYIRIYAPLRNRKFYSLSELNEAIWALLEKHNNKPFQRLDYSRRDLFEQIERTTLLQLPGEKYPQKHTIYATVGVNYHIELREDRHYYSVPYILRKRGQKVRVKVVYDERIVAIYYDNLRVIQHLRDRTPNDYTTITDHMPSYHRFYAEWSPQRILSWGKSYGEEVVKVLERILKKRKHPEQAFKVCLGILSLGKKYGREKLIQACKKANKYSMYSFKRIENMIKLIKEEQEQPELELEIGLPDHENIRGSSYYN
jgi:transposase